jgi:hypothetical protein
MGTAHSPLPLYCCDVQCMEGQPSRCMARDVPHVTTAPAHMIHPVGRSTNSTNPVPCRVPAFVGTPCSSTEPSGEVRGSSGQHLSAPSLPEAQRGVVGDQQRCPALRHQLRHCHCRVSLQQSQHAVTAQHSLTDHHPVARHSTAQSHSTAHSTVSPQHRTVSPQHSTVSLQHSTQHTAQSHSTAMDSPHS